MPTKRPKRAKRIKALEKVPPVPKSLKGKYATAYWKRITKLLVEIEMLTELHLEAIQALCVYWQDFRELSDWADDNPDQRIIVYEKSGHMVEHPNIRLRQAAYANLTKLWPKFGLTPEGQIKIEKSRPMRKPEPSNSLSEFQMRKYA